MLSLNVLHSIKSRHLMNSVFYDCLYNELKEINLVYYGQKIENQTRKKIIEMKDNRPVINEIFYEGLGDIET